VFDTAIRYNIRLRETVDYGMPIGEYDKHSIGHKDYEKLADELAGSWEASTAPGFDALEAARNFQELSEEYAAEAVETSERPQDMQGSRGNSVGRALLLMKHRPSACVFQALHQGGATQNGKKRIRSRTDFHLRPVYFLPRGKRGDLAPRFGAWRGRMEPFEGRL
jgi:hypothetical protein